MLLLILLQHLLCLLLSRTDLLRVALSGWLVVAVPEVLSSLCLLFLLVRAAGESVDVGLGVDLLHDVVDLLALGGDVAVARVQPALLGLFPPCLAHSLLLGLELHCLRPCWLL